LRNELSNEVTSYDAVRNCRRLIKVDGDTFTFGHTSVYVYGRSVAFVPPRQPVVVPESGLSAVLIPGGKCFHGVYIPATSSLAPDLAPDCSLCRPYEIATRTKNPSFKA
jgi:hypothetical protein